MEDWGDGQTALFEALTTICARVGKESAADLASAITRSNGRNFVEELRSLKEKASRVDGLQAENDRLRTELEAALQQLHRDSKSTEEQQAGTNEHTEAGIATSNDLSDRYESLVSKYNNLFINHRHMSSARQELETKLRKTRTERQDWINYANRLTKRVQRLETKLASHDLMDKGSFIREPGETSEHDNTSPVRNQPSEKVCDDNVAVARATTNPNSPSLAGFFDLEGETMIGTPEPLISAPTFRPESRQRENQVEAVHNITSDSSPQQARHGDLETTAGLHFISSYEDLPPVDARNLRSGKDDNFQSSPLHNSSSTQGDPEDTTRLDNTNSPVDQRQNPALEIKLESQPDIPVVLFSRTVKKKRGKLRSPQKSRIKAEKITSSPVRLPDSQNDNSPESIDLDNVGEKVKTPKKRKRFTSGAQANIGITRPLSQHMIAGALPNQYITHGRFDPSQSLGACTSSLATTLAVLQPLSPNKHILPRTSSHSDKRRRVEDRVKGVSSFSEDGEDGTSTPSSEPGAGALASLITERHLESPRSKRKQRLTGLLEEPSPHRLFLSPGDESPLPTSIPRTLGTKMGPKSVKPNNYDATRPLRARPVEALSLEHFKVNPSYNQGLDYAFSDVVRGREQRKCLPGCTNPACCGDTFRKMAANIVRTRNGQPTPSQEQEDELLLLEFLGANRGRLRTMAQEERDELILQARARDLAKKHGKHRHAYERRRSPPGFWRSDFPSTQEMVADRAEALKVERAMVQQRYDEAMRDGGAWLFRDE